LGEKAQSGFNTRDHLGSQLLNFLQKKRDHEEADCQKPGGSGKEIRFFSSLPGGKKKRSFGRKGKELGKRGDVLDPKEREGGDRRERLGGRISLNR